MQVKFYNANKRENSTKIVSGGTSYECTLKDDCSIIRPTLVLDISKPNYNYCYIEEFNRFYWVDTWNWLLGVWSCECHVDALASWKDYIGNSSQYVTRSASEYNGRLIDKLYPCLTKSEYEWTPIDLHWTTRVFGTEYSPTFVIGINGNGEYTGIGTVTYYLLNEGGMSTFIETLFNESIWSALKNDFENPLQCISSVMYFPINFYSINKDYENVRIKIGNREIGDDNIGYSVGAIIKSFSKTIKIMNVNDIPIPKHPQTEERGKYLNSSPYTELTLFVDPFGTIPLDTMSFIDEETLDLQMKIDLISGQGDLIVTYAGNVPYHKAHGQVGVPIELSYTQRMSINGLTSAIGSTIGAVTSFASGNILGGIIGVASAVGSAVESTKPIEKGVGATGSFLAIDSSSYLCARFLRVADDNISDKGRPLCKRKTINTLSGYILCEDVDISIPCTSQEQVEIKNYMEGGFFYE